MAAAIEMDVDGRTVRISSPDKPIFPAAGLTKLDVVTYYLDVAVVVAPALPRPALQPQAVPGRRRRQVLHAEAGPGITAPVVADHPGDVRVGADGGRAVPRVDG